MVYAVDFKITYEARDSDEAKFYHLLSKQYYSRLGLSMYFSKLSIENEGRLLTISLNGSMGAGGLMSYFLSQVYWLTKALPVTECKGEFNHLGHKGIDVVSFVDGEFIINHYIVKLSTWNVKPLTEKEFTENILLSLFKEIYNGSDDTFMCSEFNLKPFTHRANRFVEGMNSLLLKYYDGIFELFQVVKDEFLELFKELEYSKMQRIVNSEVIFRHAISKYDKEISTLESDFDTFPFDKAEDYAGDKKESKNFHFGFGFETHEKTVLDIYWYFDVRKKEVNLNHKLSARYERPQDTLIAKCFAELSNKGLDIGGLRSLFYKKIKDFTPHFLLNHSGDDLYDYTNLIPKTSPRIELQEGVCIPLTSYFVNMFSPNDDEKRAEINLRELLMSVKNNDSHYPKLHLEEKQEIDVAHLLSNETSDNERISICDICVNKIRKNTVGCNGCLDFQTLF